MILHNNDPLSQGSQRREHNPDVPFEFFPGGRAWTDPGPSPSDALGWDLVLELAMQRNRAKARDQGQVCASGGVSRFLGTGAVDLSCGPGNFPSRFPPIC